MAGLSAVRGRQVPHYQCLLGQGTAASDPRQWHGSDRAQRQCSSAASKSAGDAAWRAQLCDHRLRRTVCCATRAVPQGARVCPKGRVVYRWLVPNICPPDATWLRHSHGVLTTHTVTAGGVRLQSLILLKEPCKAYGNLTCLKYA